MALLKRFRSYFIGFGLGLLMVMFIFRDKANLFTSWLPENRVLIDLYQRDILTTPKTACQLKCLGKSVKEFKELLKDDTSVEFSKSSTQADPKVYFLVQEIDKKPIPVLVTILDSTAMITEIRMPREVQCGCE